MVAPHLTPVRPGRSDGAWRRRVRWGVGVGGVGLWLSAWAASAGWAEPLLAAEAPGEPPLSQPGWGEFLKQRIRLGIGVEEQYNSNVFLTTGGQRQDDFITTLESQVAFADPRGDWLYGGGYEINASRYRELAGRTAFDHEWGLYVHYTPLARYSLNFTAGLTANDRFVSGAEDQDVIRRFSMITQTNAASLGLKGAYRLSQRDTLRLEYGWSQLDDEAADSANIDQVSNGAALAWEHTYSRRGAVSMGYAFGNVNFSDAPTKDSQSHSMKLGWEYDLDPITTTKLETTLLRSDIASGTSSLQFNLNWTLARVVSERSKWSLQFGRITLPSTSGAAENFTTNKVSLAMSHALSPVLTVRWNGDYTHVETRTSRRDQWFSKLQFAVPIGRKIIGTVDYQTQLLSQEDIWDHTVTVGLEAQLW